MDDLSGTVLRIYENKTFKLGRVEPFPNQDSNKEIKFYRKGTWEGKKFSFEGGNIYENFYEDSPNSNEFKFLALPGYTNQKVDYYRVSNIEDPKFNIIINDKSDEVITDSFLHRDWTHNAGPFIINSSHLVYNGFNSPYTRNNFLINVPELIGANNGFVNSIDIEIFFWGENYNYNLEVFSFEEH